jgi:DNA modification methylase
LSTQSQPADARPARPWPADRIERWPIARLIPYANNPRLHSEVDLDKMVSAIRRWGWTMPVLVDEEGELIAGALRVGAATRLAFTEVPVIVARGWSVEEKRAYRVADNALAARADWHPEQLFNELQALKFGGFDLDLLGFKPEQLATILAGLRPRGLADPDSVPELANQTITRLGDLWLLGNHRVGCGDSTRAVDVAAVLAGSEPHLMVTDPPYGVNYEPSWRARRGVGAGKLARGKVLNDDRAGWREAYALFPGDVCYVWHGALQGDVVAADLAACGLRLRAQIVWAKQHFTLSRSNYHWKHETCWYAVRNGKASHWRGDRTQTTLWEIANNNPFGNPQREQSWGHGTQKPVECMRRPIANNSRLGEAIYDPFLGSGTSLIAAEMTSRACYGLELNPAYVDVIVRRWQVFTGRAALHHASGQSFDERAEKEEPEQGIAHGENSICRQ